MKFIYQRRKYFNWEDLAKEKLRSYTHIADLIK